MTDSIIVMPGTQTRRFTHIKDTVEICYLAWRENKQRHYSIASKQKYSIIEIAKLFKRNRAQHDKLAREWTFKYARA